MNIDFPYRIDARGATATASDEEHVRDLIEQVIFTSPGERVNRPEFGSGLLQLVFDPNSPELATALQLRVQAALHQWLGDLIEVHTVEVVSQDAVVHVSLSYVIRRTERTQTAEFERGV